MNLYELTGQYLELQNLLESGEYDEQLINDTLEAVEGEIEIKADNYARIIRNFEARIDSFKAEEERLKKKRSYLERSVKRLKDNLQSAMILTGKRKFTTDLFSFASVKNGGVFPVIMDVQTWVLPDDLVKVVETADLKAIETLLKTDPEEGKKYAHFGERGENLRIK